MRLTPIILLFVLAASAALSQPIHLTVKDNDDSNTVLSSLFNAKIVIDPDDSVILGRWKPNFAEAQEFNVSYDSMCYTNIDTLMDYRSSGKDYCLIVFTTYDYIDSTFIMEDCHACSPDVSVAVFSKANDSLWEFERMKKHLTRWGSWGHFDDVGLRKIGNDSYALAFEGGNGGQGFWEETVVLYELLYFGEIFTCMTHEDNSGETDVPSKRFDWDKKVDIIPVKGQPEYYDIVVSKSGRGYKNKDDYHGPIIKYSGKERYRFDDGINKYVLVK